MPNLYASLGAQLACLEELKLEVRGPFDCWCADGDSERVANVLAMLAENCPRLRRLQLPLLGPKDMEHLRPLSGCAQLRELVLKTGAGGLTTSDGGVAALQQLSQLEQLALINFDLPREYSRGLLQQLMSDRRPPGLGHLTMLESLEHGDGVAGSCSITYQHPHPPLHPPPAAVEGLAMPADAAARGAGAGAGAAEPPGPSAPMVAAAAAAAAATAEAPLPIMQRVEIGGLSFRPWAMPAMVLAAAVQLGQDFIPELVIADIEPDESSLDRLRPDQPLPRLAAGSERMGLGRLSLTGGADMKSVCSVLSLMGLPQSLRLHHGEWSWDDDLMGGGRRYRQAAAAGAAAMAAATGTAGAAGSAAAEQLPPGGPPPDLSLGAVDLDSVLERGLDRLSAWGLLDGSNCSDGGSDSGGASDGSGGDSGHGGSSSRPSRRVSGVGPALAILRGVPPPYSIWVKEWQDDVVGTLGAETGIFAGLDSSTIERLLRGPRKMVTLVPPRSVVVECASRSDAEELVGLVRPGKEQTVELVPLQPGELALPAGHHFRQCVSEVLLELWAMSGGPGEGSGSSGSDAAEEGDGSGSNCSDGGGGYASSDMDSDDGGISSGAGDGCSSRHGVELSAELHKRLEKLLELDYEVSINWEVRDWRDFSKRVW
ncbi:hypothetical protein CHLRE_14g620100v5 [Chlamydomonas reinhardtii]|uniref:Uncharacterized protein n=1 Tax=Chlamydomonas reinhardtii TaxID=3055 RepID=A0A2K3CXX0_CHLRE|nr:uncharacterized protein CHLRE_14g620100v5 [Chlamydomonas reinhardtii]PNW73135.1 hypothetical protein CHLRE_14g620100v5 [Chlamydomonas reinhardtii]